MWDKEWAHLAQALYHVGTKGEGERGWIMVFIAWLQCQNWVGLKYL